MKNSSTFKETLLGILRKHWSNILLGSMILLLLIPQTGRPIKIFLNRLVAMSPNVTEEANRNKLVSYDWKLQSHSGENINFNSFKGKKVVVSFWATWCPPCIAEMPSLQALYDDYGNEVSFLLVTNEQKHVVDEFMTDREFDLPIYYSLSSPISELESQVLPTTFIINEAGEIVVKKIGAADWNSQEVREVLDASVNF